MFEGEGREGKMCFKRELPHFPINKCFKNSGRAEWSEITSTTHFNMYTLKHTTEIQQLLHQQRILTIFPSPKYTIHLGKRLNLEGKD